MAEYIQGIFINMEPHACQTVHKTLDQQSLSSLRHGTAHDGTADKSRHWLDDKKIEIDMIVKMPPNHLSQGALVLFSLSVSLKRNLNINSLSFIHPTRQLTSHSNVQVYTHQLITLAGHK